SEGIHEMTSDVGSGLACGEQEALAATVIAVNFGNKPSRGREDPGDGGGLAVTEFDEERAARVEPRGQFGGETPVGVQPVGTAVEGGSRIVVTDLRIERLDLGGRDVGRVRHHEVKPDLRVEGRGAVRKLEADAIGALMAVHVAPRE